MAEIAYYFTLVSPYAYLGHQPLLERPDPLHRAHAEAAERRGGLARHAVEPGQTVGGQRDHERVEAAPALVAGEQLRVAEVEAEPGALDQHFGQGGGVAEAEVEPLAGDRMDAVRGIADQGEARVGDPRGMVEAERITETRPASATRPKPPCVFDLGASARWEAQVGGVAA